MLVIDLMVILYEDRFWILANNVNCFFLKYIYTLGKINYNSKI